MTTDNMAQKLKRQIYAKKFTGYVILGLIAVVFIFFGYGGSTGMGMEGVGSVARVNNTFISALDFHNEETRISDYYSSLFGGSFDLGPQRGLLKQQALENLIRNELIAQASSKVGLAVADIEVRDMIVTGIPVFQEKGQFLRDRYMAYLNYTKSTPADFEDKLRKDLLASKSRNLLNLSLEPLSLEISKNKELRSKKMNVQFLPLSQDSLIQKMTISEAMAREKLSDPESLAKIQSYFKTHQDQWNKEETVKAQHILVSFKAGDVQSENQALEKIKAAQKRLTKEEFGAVAAQISEDPGSKTKKGMLEPFGRGRMVKEFEDVAFSLKAGEVSQPVKSPFGYHLIKVLERQPAVTAEFENVKTSVAQKYLAREKAEGLVKSIEEMVSKGDLAALTTLMAQEKLTWEETGFFDLSADVVPKIPAGPVADAAYELHADKPLLNKVLKDGSTKYVLKWNGLKQEEAADDPKLAQNLRRERADSLHNIWINDFRQKSKVTMNPEVLK